MTNLEATSLVFNSLKLINKDDRISRRYVLRIMRSVSKTYISQRLAERSLNFDFNLYTELNCLEMERVESIQCPILDFRLCKILMKSKKPLPDLIFSRLGSSIRDILSVDGMFELRLIDLQKFRRDKKRKYKVKEVVAYLGIDNHLYIPDEEILAVNANLLTVETDEVDNCSECKKEKCKSGWDYEFICPDRLLDPVIKETLQIITGTVKSIAEDPNPNGADGR